MGDFRRLVAFNVCKESASWRAKEEGTARRAVDLAIKTFGSLDILMTDVGVGNYKNIMDISAAEYDEMMDSNMRSTFLFTRHTVPVMIKQGSGTILMISSMVRVWQLGPLTH